MSPVSEGYIEPPPPTVTGSISPNSTFLVSFDERYNLATKGYTDVYLDTGAVIFGDPVLQQYADIYRINDNTGDKVLVRGCERIALATGDVQFLDYEVPIKEPFHYYAEVFVDYDDETPLGTVEEGAAVRTALPYRPGRVWLHDVLRLDSLFSPQVEGVDGVTRPARNSIYEVLGRSSPIVVTAGMGSRQSTLRILTTTIAERDNLWAMLESNLLMLRSEPDYGLGSLYITVTEAEEERLTRLGADQRRRFTLTYTETERPVGSVLSGNNSWQAVVTGAATWQALIDARLSWGYVIGDPL